METKPTSFAASLASAAPQTDVTELVARFPHIKKIIDLWGSQTCRDMLNGLLHDTRDGDRAGFPREHASKIFSLLVEHDESYPQFHKDLAPIRFA